MPAVNIEYFINAAEQHGNHVVGDLQDYLRESWELLTPEQREQFRNDETVQGTLAAALNLDHEDLYPESVVTVGYFINAAQQHGDGSEPDHEIGDLQDYLRVMWALLTPEQRGQFVRDETVQDTLESAIGVGEYDTLTQAP